MSKRRYIVAPLLLLALFLTYQVSITLFTHVHIVNGVMIVHSHPSSEKHHTHTTGQVISIAHLSTIQTLEPGGQTEMTVFRPVLYVLEYKTNTFRAKVLCAQWYLNCMQVSLFILLGSFPHFGPYVLAPLFNSSFEIGFFVQIGGHMRLVEQVQKADDIPGGRAAHIL